MGRLARRFRFSVVTLETVLKQNKRIFIELTKEIDLQAPEYAPNYIQQQFNKLDDSNPLKSLWRLRMETLVHNNEMAIKRITENIGAVKSERFCQELENFIFHAQKFNNIWRLIPSDAPIEPGIDPHADLLGDRYPKDLDTLIHEEIERQWMPNLALHALALSTCFVLLFLLTKAV